MPSINTQALLNILRSDTDAVAGIGLYALLDAARQESIYPKVFETAQDYCCLYPGSKGKELAYVAPYLVALSEDDAFTDWLLQTGWGDSWGIFVTSRMDIDKLDLHFRQFLKVMDEDGKQMLFRYYDPRVLRVYLPTCNAGELRQLFGPVIHFAMENETGDGVIKYGFADGKLSQLATNL